LLRHHRQQWEHIKLKKERKGRIRVISKEEELKVIELLSGSVKNGKCAYYSEAADLVEVLVDTGLRLTEILDLKYDDINFKTNLLSIWINKGEKPRSLPMTNRVRNIIQERQKVNSTKPFCISVDKAERAWLWCREVMGLKEDKEFLLHALRHTCASRLVNAGVDLYVVSRSG
jgi:integrase